MSVPIVIDLGSGVVKAGFAGEDRPKALFHNVTGKPKHKRVMAGGALEGGDVFVGSRVDAHRGALLVSHPMEHGRVVDWEGCYRVLSHVYDAPNLALPPEEQPVRRPVKLPLIRASCCHVALTFTCLLLSLCFHLSPRFVFFAFRSSSRRRLSPLPLNGKR